jgi:MFS family permease
MFIPLFVQGVIGASATDSGYVLTPMMLSLIAGSIIGGQVISRTGRYRYVALTGIAVMAAGMLLFWRMSPDTSQVAAIRNMIIAGFGLGVTMPLYVIVVQNAFPHGQLGVVTGSIQFFRSIGGTVGVAVAGSFMNTLFRSDVAERLAALRSAGAPFPLEMADRLSNPQVLLNPEAKQALAGALPAPAQPFLPDLLEALRLSLSHAVTQAFLLGLGVVVLAWALSWFLEEIPLRKTHAAPAAAGVPEARPADAEAPAPGRTASPAGNPARESTAAEGLAEEPVSGGAIAVSPQVRGRPAATAEES